jgi:SAM-dependent methyltransferase
MNQSENYYSYLKRYSSIGDFYRKFLLYPKFNEILQGKILDVGCGLGHYLTFQLGAQGVDINPINVADCLGRGLDASVMLPDILLFEDMSFDSVLLDNVLEHIAEPFPLISEIKRVLRSDGTLLIGVPGLKGMAHDPDHKVAYDEISLAALANASGFFIRDFFYMPLFKSEWLSKNLRQYCTYSIWVKK